MEPGEILAAAENLLIAHGDSAGLRLEPLNTYATTKSVVVRCRLLPAPKSMPESVVVKYLVPRPGFPLYDTYAALDEWTACHFLNTIPSDPPLAPKLYGGDADRNILVLEDLGAERGPNTAALLDGDDPGAAEQELLEHVTLLARLHGTTLGGADDYTRLRTSLGPQPARHELYKDPWSNARRTPTARHEVTLAVTRYRAVFERLGLRAEARADAEIEEATQRVEDDPGPYLGFCKGDQHLGGDYIRTRDGRRRLYDFDAGGFRHVLIEGMPGRMTWGCYGHIPARVVSRMETAYYTELVRYCPAAADPITFRRAMADAGARWNVFHVIHRLPVALQRDGPQGPTTMRRLRLAWLEAFADLSEELGHYASLGRSARTMAVKLRDLWSIGARPQPIYRAFA